MIPGQAFYAGRLGGETDMWVSMIDVSLARVVRRGVASQRRCR